MKGKKKGISSILGALIFLQILLISLLLVIHVINNETNITLKSVQIFQALSENAPIEEEVENNITYLYSTTPFIITHIIYPNGEIVNTSIMVNGQYPVSQVLNGFPWAIIVTNKGTWYNVTPLGDSNYNSGLIIFPYYPDYGMPLDPSVLDLNLPTGLQSAFSPAFPDWNVLEGIASPSALSLVPINVTIGDPATYNWALTDAVLVFYPLSPDGWINITYYLPIQYRVFQTTYPITICLFNNTINSFLFTWDRINGSIGVYIPINMSATFAFNPLKAPNKYITQNISILEYISIYDGNSEITNFSWVKQSYVQDNHSVYVLGYLNYSWTYTQIGSSIYTPPPGCFYFWSYLIASNPQNVFGVPITNNPYCYPVGENPINLPPTNWFNWSKIPPYNLYPLWNVTHTEFVPQYFGEHFIPIVYIPITVYQVDINLHKGEALDYAYDGYNNTWLLLYNWTFNYNNPAMYINAYKYFVQNGYHHLPCVYYNNEWGYVFPYNINNIEYLTEYPVYVVVPDGVYLLQVSLS